MTSSRHVDASFGGRVFCHAPADQPFDLDALARPAEDADRWSVPGTLTAYLASTSAVAAAEWARHAGDGPDRRAIVALVLRPIDVLDLRRSLPSEPDRPADPDAFLDRERTRGAAAEARRQGVRGILVPSVAFPDRVEDAFNIVLFCERLTGGIGAALTEPRPVGRIEVGPLD